MNGEYIKKLSLEEFNKLAAPQYEKVFSNDELSLINTLKISELLQTRVEVLNEIPEIDAVVGTGNYRDICDIVERILSGEKKIIKVDNINCNLDFEDRILTTPKQFAYVKIAEGCSNNCLYRFQFCILNKTTGINNYQISIRLIINYIVSLF
jgi:tRNA A37 methylthiotransferase MiaB